MKGLGRHFILVAVVLWIVCTGLAQVPEGTAQQQVGGRVVNSLTGEPVAHAMVTLDDTRAYQAAATVLADDQGRYRFAPVSPGKYRLVGEARGFLGSAYLQHGDLSTAVVTGAGLPVEDLVLSLVPEASITGRLLSEDGEPVAQATVSLYTRATVDGLPRMHMVGNESVGDDGAFDFAMLEPGRYFLVGNGKPWYAVYPPHDPPGALQLFGSSVDPALNVAYPPVFYPAALQPEEAREIVLVGGESFVANMQMMPEPAVSLTVRQAPGHSGALVSPQLDADFFGAELPVHNAMTLAGPNGEFTLDGLAPGRYHLQQFLNGARLPEDERGLDLTNGSIVMDAPSAPPLSSVSIQVQSATGKPLPGNLQILLTLPERGAINSAVSTDGRAEFSGVVPGTFRVSGTGDEHLLAAASLSVGGHPVPDLHLRVPEGGGHVVATLTLSGNLVDVEGFAKRDGKAAAGSLILLVPAGGDTEAELFRRDQSDLDGSFTLAAVLPGKYLLLALDNAWSLPWADLRVLTPYLLHAQPVTVSASAGETVHLPTPISPQDFH